jgi:hypothetical protein
MYHMEFMHEIHATRVFFNNSSIVPDDGVVGETYCTCIR